MRASIPETLNFIKPFRFVLQLLGEDWVCVYLIKDL